MQLTFIVSLSAAHYPSDYPIALNLVSPFQGQAVLTMLYFPYSYLHHIGAFADPVPITFSTRECCCGFSR